MKSLVILCLFVTLVWADNYEDCAKETKVSDKEVARFIEDDLTSEDAAVHCYVRCLLGKQNFYDAAGLPKKEVIQPYLEKLNPGKDVAASMASCLKLVASDGEASCHTSYIRYKCAIGNGIVMLEEDD